MGWALWHAMDGSPDGRPRCKWEDNIKMDLTQVVCEGADQIKLTMERIHLLAFLNTVMILWVS
jgi:hypothetical protein